MKWGSENLVILSYCHCRKTPQPRKNYCAKNRHQRKLFRWPRKLSVILGRFEWHYKKMSNKLESFIAHFLSPLRCGRDSNSRPHAWQACILTNWTTEPFYLPLSSPPPSNHFAKIQPFLKLPKLFGWKMKKNNKTLVNLLIFRTFANAKKSGLGWFWQRG